MDTAQFPPCLFVLLLKRHYCVVFSPLAKKLAPGSHHRIINLRRRCATAQQARARARHRTRAKARALRMRIDPKLTREKTATGGY